MKDMSLTVKYARTDTGCLQVFIMKNGKYFEHLTIFPDNTTWLDISKDNKSQVYVYPHNALHRIWSQEICRVCGWKSEPFEGKAIGFGGTFNCPECQKVKRSPTLEGCYGNVYSINLDWETKQPKVKP